LGSIIALICYFISFYTCKLIVETIGEDADYSDTLKKYFGKKGYYAGLIAPAFLMIGAVTVLFVILAQISYPIILAVYTWCSGIDKTEQQNPTFEAFSSSYTALVLFFVAVLVCSKKDLNIFIKMGSFGAFFVSMLIIFITATGIIAMTNTNYQIGTF
jgi:amino acid permease